jgi:hypothetical protein
MASAEAALQQACPCMWSALRLTALLEQLYFATPADVPPVGPLRETAVQAREEALHHQLPAQSIQNISATSPSSTVNGASCQSTLLLPAAAD